MTENQLRNYIVNSAIEYLGIAEGSKKHLDIVNTYNGIKPLPRGYKLKTSDSWCAAFVSAMAAKCGLLDIIPAECSCPNQISLWQKKGRWQESDAYVPKPGDIIYYDWDDTGTGDNKGVADHVGIVCAVSGGNIKVVEGNKADTVAYRTIAVNGKYIRGYGLPDYKSKAKEKENMERWKTVNDIPKGFYRDEANKLIKSGVLEGKGDGTLDITEDMLRCMIFCRRIMEGRA